MDGLAPNLDSRLLYAAGCAYAPRPAASPYYAGAGWQSPPLVDTRGFDDIDQALVGQTVDGNVVAFRGTVPPGKCNDFRSFSDWLSNFDAPLVFAEGHSGLVHQGFQNALDSLWPALWAEVQRLPEASLFVTGHSKGGGVATLAAARMAAHGTSPRVITFASPKPGNAAFVGGLNFTQTRWEYADDIVPHLPPSIPFLGELQSLPVVGRYFAELGLWANYEPAGCLNFIDWSGVLQADSALLANKREIRLLEKIVTGQFMEIIGDHSIAAGSGYESGVRRLAS